MRGLQQQMSRDENQGECRANRKNRRTAAVGRRNSKNGSSCTLSTPRNTAAPTFFPNLQTHTQMPEHHHHQTSKFSPLSHLTPPTTTSSPKSLQLHPNNSTHSSTHPHLCLHVCTFLSVSVTGILPENDLEY